jgi:hypothetical protein
MIDLKQIICKEEGFDQKKRVIQNILKVIHFYDPYDS